MEIDPNGRIAEAIDRTAVLLAERFTSGGALRERQFEHVFEEALVSDPAVRVLPGKRPQLAHWREPFAIDTTAVLPGGDILAAELKWGAGVLYNCAWDLAKLAVVIAEGVAHGAYLVAGAPNGDWDGAPGAELFSDGAWSPQELGDRFRKHFDFWAKDVPTTGPTDLPAGITTAGVSAVDIPRWRDPWGLRASRLEVVHPAWISWASLDG
jgi:hypothetical protein